MKTIPFLDALSVAMLSNCGYMCICIDEYLLLLMGACTICHTWEWDTLSRQTEEAQFKVCRPSRPAATNTMGW